MLWMLLIGEKKLRIALQTHIQAKTWINTWVATVGKAEWQSLIDVRRDYPSADGVKQKSGRVVTIFNVGGNKYRLLTAIDYAQGLVQFVNLMTHAEYDKEKWK